MSHDLRLHQQLLLLGLRDEEGTLERRSGMLNLALGGALLTELVQAGRVAVEPEGKHFVHLLSEDPVDDEILDDCLQLVAAAKKRRRASAWVSKLGGRPKLRHRIAAQLCRLGVLQDSEDKVLLFFTRKAYPTIDPAPERALVERIRAAVLGEEPPDEELAILIALAYATGLLRVHLTDREIKSRKARLEQIVDQSSVGEATKAAVQAVRAAILVATTTAATTAAISG